MRGLAYVKQVGSYKIGIRAAHPLKQDIIRKGTRIIPDLMSNVSDRQDERELKQGVVSLND